MAYIIIAIVILLIVVVGVMVTLNKYVDKTSREIMTRFSMVNNRNISDRNQDITENVASKGRSER